jgi:hypothetical protein
MIPVLRQPDFEPSHPGLVSKMESPAITGLATEWIFTKPSATRGEF